MFNESVNIVACIIKTAHTHLRTIYTNITVWPNYAIQKEFPLTRCRSPVTDCIFKSMEQLILKECRVLPRRAETSSRVSFCWYSKCEELWCAPALFHTSFTQTAAVELREIIGLFSRKRSRLCNPAASFCCPLGQRRTIKPMFVFSVGWNVLRLTCIWLVDWHNHTAESHKTNCVKDEQQESITTCITTRFERRPIAPNEKLLWNRHYNYIIDFFHVESSFWTNKVSAGQTTGTDTETKWVIKW